MFPDESFGSATSVPTEFSARLPLSHVQAGFAARASFVRQTPPPALPAQRRQLPGTHVGATTSPVIRLAVSVSAPENESTPGWIEFCTGPYGSQWLLPCESPTFAIFSKVALAFWTNDGGITFAGYVLWADRYASYPSIGPSPGVAAACLAAASGSL